MIEQMVMAVAPLALALAGYWLGVAVSEDENNGD